jgi:mannose-1-phosphate guanylyltransferase/mannose-6-phosphate isomerase
MTGARVFPVILSGGSGSRLWPLSREDFPKQLQALATEKTLLQETALRIAGGTIKAEAPIIVCNEAHRFIVAEQLRAIDVAPKSVIIEPVGRNTAPAIAVAALLIAREDPDGLLLSMASDHIVRRPEAFRAALKPAIAAARSGRLVTIGITPTGPDPRFGYIQRGEAIAETGAFAVRRFVEKPSVAVATQFLKDGGCAWNASIFLFPVGLFLEELGRYEPELLAGCRAALAKGESDLFFTRLDAQAFAALASRSVDHGVMERTAKAAMVPVDMGWSDVGSWSALHAEHDKDDSGNTLLGDVIAIDTTGSYVRSEKQLTTVLGVRDLAVVVTPDAVLIADKARDQDVKAIVDRLKAAKRPEATQQARTYRPWGWFQTMDEGHRFKVKRLVVKPGAKLSLQKHWHRSEHWVVVTGAAEVTCGPRTFVLHENESTFIPAGTVHRLANPGRVELHMIEVQSGEYVGEDDIVRLVDDYGRGGSSPARRPGKAKAAKEKRPARRKAGAVPSERRGARRGRRRRSRR